MQTELRVLIADDEPAALHGLARRLAATPGVRVIATCVNGIEALERIRATRPDAALPSASCGRLSHTASQLPTSDQPMSARTTAANDVRSITA